jgi:hypothetical protein
MMMPSLLATLIVSAFTAPPRAAQPPAAMPVDSTATQQLQTVARDSIRVHVSPELQRSLDELAATLDRLGRRIANDPELRASAVRTAQSLVSVAQVVVVQQADVLQEALKTAAERLADVAPPAAPPAR